jgi:hypothetical protein
MCAPWTDWRIEDVSEDSEIICTVGRARQAANRGGFTHTSNARAATPNEYRQRSHPRLRGAQLGCGTRREQTLAAGDTVGIEGPLGAPGRVRPRRSDLLKAVTVVLDGKKQFSESVRREVRTRISAALHTDLSARECKVLKSAEFQNPRSMPRRGEVWWVRRGAAPGSRPSALIPPFGFRARQAFRSGTICCRSGQEAPLLRLPPSSRQVRFRNPK